MSRSSTITRASRYRPDYAPDRFNIFSAGQILSQYSTLDEDDDYELLTVVAPTVSKAPRVIDSWVVDDAVERRAADASAAKLMFWHASNAAMKLASDVNEEVRTSRPRWHSPLSHIIRELGRFKDGWAGAESRAPSDAIIRNIQATVALLPVGAREPEAEVEPDDGAVSVSWTSVEKTASFTLTFFPSGKVGGAYASAEGSLPGWICNIQDQRKMNAHINEPRVLQLVCG